MPKNITVTDILTAIGAIITAFGVIVAVLTLIEARLRYQHENLQQKAARTREDLHAIIGSCNRFLYPLSQNIPYPILHTATAITKEIFSRLGPSPKTEDVLRLLSNEDLLHSICVEGWISSSQILHLMDIVEEVEHKASSRNVQGKLLLICNASFLLAGIVANVCSPDFFYEIASELKPEKFRREKVENYVNALNVGMQNRVCEDFDRYYKQAVVQTLYLIQVASNAFMNLKDKKLVKLAGTQTGQMLENSPSKAGEDKTITETLDMLRCNASLPARIEQLQTHLLSLEKDIDPNDYIDLCNLADSISKNCKLFPENCVSNNLDKLGFCIRNHPALVPVQSSSQS